MTASTTPNAHACDLTLFVACYNEEHGVIPSIETVVAAANEVGCTFDIVVVDDGSKDNSVKVVRQYMDEHPELPITLVVNEVNQGVGVNFAAGAFFGRGKYYRMICGDDTETKETLVEVFRRLGEADMILTYHIDSRARHWMRRVISRVFTFLVNRISGYRIHYYNGLAVHLRQNVMLWHSNAHGFGFQADLITRLLDMGATYTEVPVVPLERAAGKTSAFTLRNFASVGHTMLELFIRRVAKLLYPNFTSRLKHGYTVYETPTVQKPHAEPTRSP
ncbi:MAG: glycosyltransferase family 2 protein [Thermoguttaceae bacterium]|jgi:glycosyltransferase involved in cell wall biosynthesis